MLSPCMHGFIWKYSGFLPQPKDMQRGEENKINFLCEWLSFQHFYLSLINPGCIKYAYIQIHNIFIVFLCTYLRMSNKQ